MKKIKSVKSIFLITALSLLIEGSLSAASKKKKTNKKKNSEPVVEQEAEAADVSGADFIKLPSEKVERSFFQKISPEILSGVQNGSPEALKAAMASMRQKKTEYDDAEKVLAVVAAEIMRIVWPYEKITWDIPEAPNDNPYIGALETVRHGLFDSSTGNVDFLSTLLPAIVIMNSSSNSSVIEPCEDALVKALAMQPDSVLANYLMAVLCEKKTVFDAAEQYYSTAYNASPKTEEIGLAYARVLRVNGKLNSAAEILGGLDVSSNDIAVLKQNAYIAFDSRDFDAAELYVAKVLQQTPNDLEFLLFRAKILIEKNDYIHAVALLDMYARQENNSIDYLILRARVQLDWSKNTAAATETVEKALQLYPDNTDALMFAARIASETDAPVAGKYADELAASVLAKRPESKEAMSYALDGLVHRENWQEAYSVSKSLISDSEVSPSVVEKYVRICLKLGKNNEAYEFARARHNSNPSDENLMQAYVLAYSSVGSRDAVIKYIDSQINTSSQKMKSYLYYRRSFLQLTEEKSLADLRSSLISNPRNSDALFRLYELYYAKQDYRKAQYYLRQVVAINPNDSSFKKLNEALTKLIQ